MSWTAPHLNVDMSDSSPDPVWDEVRLINGEPLYRDRNGQPMTLRQWSTALNTTEYRILGRTAVGDTQVITRVAWHK